jgi:hypothetical protein
VEDDEDGVQAASTVRSKAILVIMAIARAALFIAKFSLSDEPLQLKIERPMVA